ncbi:MAG: glucose-1-phosphate adenylyltransferase subunit GlgD [Clostridiales bacterium]|nr:glucose-1-phosphate adenylyltransferase subunit GlgD [Clostridiales bacterium]
MLDVLGIIFAHSERENLRELTDVRTLASVPMAGKYRMIDFILSNFVNQDIGDVSIIARNRYHSLLDHLGVGREWDLIRKRGGLRILTPYGQASTNTHAMYRGTIEALAANMHSFRRSMAQYVILAGSCMIYNMDFEHILKSHIDRGADITAVYVRRPGGRMSIPLHMPILHMDEEERIMDLQVNGDDMTPNDSPWGTGVYVIRKSLLESLVADAMVGGRYDFQQHIIQRLAPVLKILGYEYKGHLMEVSTVSGYMQANMAFLDPAVRSQVFAEPIYTKIKDSVPVVYSHGCCVKNSIISDGCHIEGTVENCVISRNVRIGKGAVVRNSIIMQHTEVLSGVSLDHVILDKDVMVRENRSLSGHSSYPVVVGKGSIV